MRAEKSKKLLGVAMAFVTAFNIFAGTGLTVYAENENAQISENQGGGVLLA